jgi:hypothetical protein
MFRQSWFDFGDKNMLKLLNLEQFFFDQVIPPDREVL